MAVVVVVMMISYDDDDGIRVIHDTNIRSRNTTNFLCAIVDQNQLPS